MFGGLFGGGGGSSNDKDSSSASTSDTFSAPTSSPSPFASSPSPSSFSNTSGSDTKARLKEAIVQQSNLINAKYLIQKINDNCFEHCVESPGSSLSSRERTCLSTCMEKYIDGWNVVSKTYVSRLQKEGAAIQNMARKPSDDERELLLGR